MKSFFLLIFVLCAYGRLHAQIPLQHFSGTVTDSSGGTPVPGVPEIFATPVGGVISGNISIGATAFGIGTDIPYRGYACDTGKTYQGNGLNAGYLTISNALGSYSILGVESASLTNCQQIINFNQYNGGAQLTIYCAHVSDGSFVTNTFSDYSLDIFPLKIPIPPQSDEACTATISIATGGTDANGIGHSYGLFITLDSLTTPPADPDPTPTPNPPTPTPTPTPNPPTPPTPKPPTPPAPPPPCVISSKTTATSPQNRSRTRIGVGERVELSVSSGNPTWHTNGVGKIYADPFSPNGVTFVAPDRAGTSTITAKVDKGFCSISFTTVQPTGVRLTRYPGTPIIHVKDNPTIGFYGEIFLMPDDVSFENVEVKEEAAKFVATGVYSFHNGKSHDDVLSSDAAIPNFVVPGFGTVFRAYDKASIGGGFSKPPFEPGYCYIDIPWDFRVGAGSWYKNFITLQHFTALEADGTLTASKGGYKVSINIHDPTSIVY